MISEYYARFSPRNPELSKRQEGNDQSRGTQLQLGHVYV
jgi:hypothetical protein